MSEEAAFVTAGCALLRIPLDPNWADGVVGHLRVMLAMAEALTQPPQPDEADPAPVFHA